MKKKFRFKTKKSRFETIREDIEKIIKLKRKKHHPAIHEFHYAHRISRKTIFYMKEYGPRSHVSTVIIKESIKILILASVISSIGGVAIQNIEKNILTILPLIILLPALNNLIGSFGAVVSSKFTVLLYLGKVGRWWRSGEVRELFINIMLIALLSSVFLGVLSFTISVLRGFEFSTAVFMKIMAISLISTTGLVIIIFFMSVLTGYYVYKKQEDPSNFLIPIATSFGDLGSMALFSFFVAMLF